MNTNSIWWEILFMSQTQYPGAGVPLAMSYINLGLVVTQTFTFHFITSLKLLSCP